MNCFQQLWNDDRGAVLSAEVVTVGTVVVLGSITGLSVAANAIDGELKDFAYAIRSLDQSYAFNGHKSCGAYTAGSRFQQQDVQESIQALCAEPATAVEQKHPVKPVIVPVVPEADAPKANQLPEPVKKEPKKKAKEKRNDDDNDEVRRPPQSRSERDNDA